MNELYYVGLDVHKRTISFCVKQADGRVVKQGTVAATLAALGEWAAQLPGQWSRAMEATMFTGWIYDFLRPRAVELQVAHSYMLRAIAAAKKKNDPAGKRGQTGGTGGSAAEHSGGRRGDGADLGAGGRRPQGTGGHEKEAEFNAFSG